MAGNAIPRALTWRCDAHVSSHTASQVSGRRADGAQAEGFSQSRGELAAPVAELAGAGIRRGRAWRTEAHGSAAAVRARPASSMGQTAPGDRGCERRRVNVTRCGQGTRGASARERERKLMPLARQAVLLGGSVTTRRGDVPAREAHTVLCSKSARRHALHGLWMQLLMTHAHLLTARAPPAVACAPPAAGQLPNRHGEEAPLGVPAGAAAILGYLRKVGCMQSRADMAARSQWLVQSAHRHGCAFDRSHPCRMCQRRSNALCMNQLYVSPAKSLHLRALRVVLPPVLPVLLQTDRHSRPAGSGSSGGGGT